MDMTDIFQDKKFRFDRQKQLCRITTLIYNKNKQDKGIYAGYLLLKGIVS